MSDINEVGSTPDAYSTEGVYGDNPSTEETNALQEELFELVEGKNSDGSPIKKSLTKAEMLELAQKGFGANKSFEEAKATKAQMKELARAMSDPTQLPAVLKHLGIDLDSFIQERMAHQMLENMKSPEEKEMEQYRKEAEEFRRMKAEQAKQDEETQINQRAQEIRQSLYSRIEETLNTAGVPKTQTTVAEVSRYIKMMADSAARQGKQFDINTVKLESIVSHMKAKQKETFESLFADLDDDGTLAMLPEALQKKIAAALTKKMSGAKITDINSINREPKQTQWNEQPADRKQKTINTAEANKIFEDRIAHAQAQWDKQNRR
jgi:hypothetical protein